MCSPSAPKPPDPQKTAAAQTGTNIGTAVANGFLGNVNQVTPYGNLTYSQTGTNKWTDPSSGKTYDLPQITAEQTFTPKGRRINDANMGAQVNMAELARDQSRRLGNTLNQKFDTSGLTSLGRVPHMRKNIVGAGQITDSYGTDFSKDRQKVENALMQRMQGGLTRDKNALEDRLASQGIQMGSAAYEAAMGDYGRQTNDARLGAILAGGQEQSRMVGLEADRAAFENAAQGQQWGQNAQQAAFGNSAQAQEYGMRQDRRNAQLDERFALRSQPINEIAALLGGTQVQQPNFVNARGPQAATTDYAGIINNNYAQQMAGYNARQQGMGGMMGGIGSLIGAGIRTWG